MAGGIKGTTFMLNELREFFQVENKKVVKINKEKDKKMREKNTQKQIQNIKYRAMRILNFTLNCVPTLKFITYNLRLSIILVVWCRISTR